MSNTAYLQKKIKNILVKLDRWISCKYFTPFANTHTVLRHEEAPFLNISLKELPQEAACSLDFYNQIRQTEYAYSLTGSFFIEPHSGWILNKSKNQYFNFSIPYKELSALPSFYKIKLKSYKVQKIKKVINLRYYFFNYWHFFNDVLGQLALIDSIEQDRSIPILIPANTLQIPYVRDAINSSILLNDRNWQEHEQDTLIEAEQVLTVKNLPNTKKNFLNIFHLLQFNNQSSCSTTGRKIFMKRASHIKRALSNTREIEELMLQSGFEIIDNDNLSFEEQVAIYKEARLVIGIHGAGLTNLMFRYPFDMHFIEIFPANSIPPHYFWLCNELGFRYSCVVGEAMIKNNFYLAPEKLHPFLKA